MRCGNCQPFEGSQQSNTPAGVSSPDLETAHSVVTFLLRRNSWPRFPRARSRSTSKTRKVVDARMLKKTFKYRLYPNKAQAEALSGQLSERPVSTTLHFKNA